MMGVRNAIIIGCAAVFNDDQNHAFLLQIFAELLKRLQTGTETRYASVRGLPVYLFLAGDGPCRNKLLQMTRDLGLSMQVMYPGICSNMADYYGAMDYYVSVTGCSGVTQAVLEAQVSGLPCLVSDTIAKEANITGLVSYMSIGRSSEEWAEAILNDLVEKRLGNRARDEVFGEAIDEVGAYDDDTLKKLRRLLYADDKPVPGRKSRPVKVKRTPEDEKRLCSALLNRDASAQLLLEIFGRERLNVADKTLLMQRFYNGVTQKGLVRE
jgi:glycosyltransferase involved in cell wall biosynthesis